MFDLRRRIVSAPNGEKFERTHVSTPGAVAVVALTAADEVVLVRQYRAALGGLVIELPAGMRDIPGEDPSVTAMRELAEETGYVAEQVEFLGRMLSSPGVTDSMVEIFVAHDVTSGEAAPHGPEEDAMEVMVVPFSVALAMVDTGEITDSKTVVGLLAHERRRSRFEPGS